MSSPRLSFARAPRLLAGLSTWLLLSLTAPAQTTEDGLLTGRVIDAPTTAVLSGAEVIVQPGGLRTTTARDGTFSLRLAPGTYEVTVNYLGQPSKTLTVTIPAGGTADLPVAMSDDIVQMETFSVSTSREGQARALNQQRSAQNLTAIVSSDLSGQFPDKTIADAVSRLPGISVETDRDTGGDEGRYVTIRGLSARFNTVTVNGMRVNVTNFDGVSRAVPLDVVSARSADQIEVTKAVRPDQDGDGIGGQVNIVTRSPFDRDARFLTAEGALSFRRLLDQFNGDYPFENPGYEGAVSFSDTFADKTLGFAFSANARADTFVKQRISSQGWALRDFTPSTGSRITGFVPVSIAFQDFFDDAEIYGFNGTFEYRPSTDHKLRFDAQLNERETNRGRQRQVVNFSGGSFVEAPTLTSDTYTRLTRSGNRLERNVRDFYETQTTTTLSVSGESRLGDIKINYLAGWNRGEFEGDPDRDINARFRTATGNTTYIANGYTPAASSTIDRFDPTRFTLQSLDRGTRYTTDDEYNIGSDVTLDSELVGGRGFWKVGAKLRDRSRDRDDVQNFFFSSSRWTPAGYVDAAGTQIVGSIVAGYAPKSLIDGAYSGSSGYGFYLDPARTRDAANELQRRGLLSAATDNALRSAANSYEADEEVLAAYGMGQFTWGDLTVLAGARVEWTDISWKGANAEINSIGDYIRATPFSSSHDYVDVLPGIHLRFAPNSKWVYRAAITQSIARGEYDDINPARNVDNFDLIIREGRLDLKPTSSTAVDVAVEYYFSSTGFVSLGAFYKDMSDNIYTQRSLIAGGSFDGYEVRRAQNAKSAEVTGVEFAFDQRLAFLPSPFDGLGVGLNLTYSDSEVDLGFPIGNVNQVPLFNQVDRLANASVYYSKYGFSFRAALSYRGEQLFDVDPTRYELSRFEPSRTTLDLSASYSFLTHWQVYGQIRNALNEPVEAYNGNQSLRPDYREYTDWSARVGIRWNL